MLLVLNCSEMKCPAMDQVFSPESFITIHKYSKKEKILVFLITNAHIHCNLHHSYNCSSRLLVLKLRLISLGPCYAELHHATRGGGTWAGEGEVNSEPANKRSDSVSKTSPWCNST